jgi:hypothetical protein
MNQMFFCSLLVLAACSGCPAPSTPPAQGPITVVLADGSSQVVSTTTACGPISTYCGVDAGTCISDLDGLVSNAPVDLLCLTSAKSKLQLQTGGLDGGPCPGLGSFCK